MPDETAAPTREIRLPGGEEWAGELGILLETNGPLRTFRVSGQLCSYSAPWLSEEVAAPPLHRGSTSFDLGALTFIDLSGVRALLTSAEVLRRRGGEVSFLNVPAVVTRLTEILEADLT